MPGGSSAKLKAPPLQVVEVEDGVILVRGCTEFKVAGPQASEVIQALLARIGRDGASREEIGAHFPAPYLTLVEDLLGKLVERRLLVPEESPAAGPPPEGETIFDVFYWHFGESASRVAERLNRRKVSVLGVNAISRQLARSLRASGLDHLEVVDFGVLRNLSLFGRDERAGREEWPSELGAPLAFEAWRDQLDPDALGCLVAASEFGVRGALREWNAYCVASGIQFLPVLLDRMIGQVGPFVVPGETACYECLRARENACSDDPEAERATEFAAFERQAIAGFLPPMASVLGDLAALELVRFWSGTMPPRVGTVLEVRLLASEMRPRKVLRVPRCPVCSRMNKRSSVNLEREGRLPGNAPSNPNFRLLSQPTE